MPPLQLNHHNVVTHRVHTLILGSGAAGLNAAVRLDAAGIKDILIVTEGLQMGTSINTGSDKQTYYKLGMYGAEPDSPEAMAHSLFDGGSMHGDLALVEAAGSAMAFLNLVSLGVKFPRDSYGQFVGYKTDHDPRQRATSYGPYTSREMCRVLINEVKRRGIRVDENRVAVTLLTVAENGEKRAAGIIAVNLNADTGAAVEVYAADNVIFAAGGPGGIYHTSVYPQVHTGGIGLALQAGAKAQNLPESQYGMASTKFRWNVSGTYMQVLPRFISTAADGISDEQEFLIPYFNDAGALNSAVFLKGYQWPFDPRKVVGGSSLIDICVYIETVIRGRRVFMDFRSNPTDLDFDKLSSESREYLRKSGALFGSPIERLRHMNPDAISLYQDHGIHLVAEPLEIAVCAQHNNGGIAGNAWSESLNIKHLFPVGEVNGSHGVYRPGGAALNAGQVASVRAAEYIAARYAGASLNAEAFNSAVTTALAQLEKLTAGNGAADWEQQRAILQQRMTRAGAHIRSLPVLEQAIPEAWAQYHQLQENGCGGETTAAVAESLRNLQLCFAHAVYLEAVAAALRRGIGSRGSALVLDNNGTAIHQALSEEWRFAPENPEFREKVQETVADCGKVENVWVERRPLPVSGAWFETAWADYREGKIYETTSQ